MLKFDRTSYDASKGIPMRSRNVVLTAIIAALYAVLVIVFAPISFLLFQVRIADMLIPLSLIYGVPASNRPIIGMSCGEQLRRFGMGGCNRREHS